MKDFFIKPIQSFQVCVAMHGKITKNNKFVIYLQHLKWDRRLKTYSVFKTYFCSFHGEGAFLASIYLLLLLILDK